MAHEKGMKMFLGIIIGLGIAVAIIIIAYLYFVLTWGGLH